MSSSSGEGSRRASSSGEGRCVSGRGVASSSSGEGKRGGIIFR